MLFYCVFSSGWFCLGFIKLVWLVDLRFLLHLENLGHFIFKYFSLFFSYFWDSSWMLSHRFPTLCPLYFSPFGLLFCVVVSNTTSWHPWFSLLPCPLWWYSNPVDFHSGISLWHPTCLLEVLCCSLYHVCVSLYPYDHILNSCFKVFCLLAS